MEGPLSVEVKQKKKDWTRLEMLSRPKAPKILQELLSNSEELRSPRQTKLRQKEIVYIVKKYTKLWKA